MQPPEALSNILGGIGYFHGSIKQKQKKNKDEKDTQKKGLFTATPCRSYFARGFLWDEGFHQLIISKWDLELSLDMVNIFIFHTKMIFITNFFTFPVYSKNDMILKKLFIFLLKFKIKN